MRAKIGDKVKLLNEPGEGVIIGLPDANTLRVELDGFEYDFSPSEVVVISADNESESWFEPNMKAINQRAGIEAKVVSDNSNPQYSIPKQAGVEHTNLGYRQVDLHIEKLVPQHQRLSNAEMLEIQLQHFEHHLAAARKHHETKVIFIHGVGAGVLKSELRKRLGAYLDCEFNDASYHLYGYGATEVHLL